MSQTRILIVDDSAVFRGMLKQALSQHPDIEVVGVAANGEIALDFIGKNKVDLITLDLEMPVMDGLTTLDELKKRNLRVSSVVFSAHSLQGADVALEALSRGATDFLPKPSGNSYDKNLKGIQEELIPRIEGLVKRQSSAVTETPPLRTTPHLNRNRISHFEPEAIVVGSSTGGPQALEVVFGELSESRCPVFIVQHMPPVFTTGLAKRLDQLSGNVVVCEAKQGEIAKPGHVYVAPGDFHMFLERRGTDIAIRLEQSEKRNCVRPAVDYLFESASEIFGSRLLGLVLTGMGEDGLDGARAIKKKQGLMLIQDEASSVVFGMPGAIFADGCYDHVAPLNETKEIFQRVAQGKLSTKKVA